MTDKRLWHIELLRDWLAWALADPRPPRQHGVRRARAVLATPAGSGFDPMPLDVDRLREAVRRVGLPFEVTVADIEDLAAEYDRLAIADPANGRNIPSGSKGA